MEAKYPISSAGAMECGVSRNVSATIAQVEDGGSDRSVEEIHGDNEGVGCDRSDSSNVGVEGRDTSNGVGNCKVIRSTISIGTIRIIN